VPRGRYERLYSGYKRRRSLYKGCSGPRSGTVYEVHLLAHETPVWTLLLSARIRANDPKLLALAELMSRYMSARDPRSKAKRVGPTQSRGDGRLSPFESIFILPRAEKSESRKNN
jgi:hypothetical protein